MLSPGGINRNISNPIKNVPTSFLTTITILTLF